MGKRFIQAYGVNNWETSALTAGKFYSFAWLSIWVVHNISWKWIEKDAWDGHLLDGIYMAPTSVGKDAKVCNIHRTFYKWLQPVYPVHFDTNLIQTNKDLDQTPDSPNQFGPNQTNLKKSQPKIHTLWSALYTKFVTVCALLE